MEAWAKNAKSLAEWTWANLVNRVDIWGAYRPLEHRKEGESKSYTAPSVRKRGRVSLTAARIQAHYEAKNPGNVIGLHSISMANTCRWVALDVDNHTDAADMANNEAQVVAVYDFLCSVDFSCLLTDSNGKGGFHLLIPFAEPLASDAAYHWIRKISADCGVAWSKPPEQFPKQSVLEDGKCGNFLRLPGRHHTTDHYSRAWDGGEWLEGEDAIQSILATRLNPVPQVDVPAAVVSLDPSLDELLTAEEAIPLASQCLAAIPPDSGYEEWIRVGMALHRVAPAAGLNLWDGWSSRGESYKPGECEKKWASFGNRTNGKRVGISTLLRYAEAAGVRIEIPKPAVGSAWQMGSPPAAPLHPTPAAILSGSEDPAPLHLDPDAPRPRLANIEDHFFQDGKGRDCSTQHHIPLPTIARAIWSTTGGWPVRAGGILFIAQHKDVEIPDRSQITWISNDPSQLFAWLAHIGDVRWSETAAEAKDGTLNPPTKRELFHYLKDHARNYRAVECLPHHPPLKDVYYLPHRLPAPVEGHSPLAELMSRLNCETEADRSLMLAALLTPGWGGPAGTRPAFVFASDHGRRSGKTATASAFARIWGECLSIGANEDWAKVKGRLLGDAALTTRVCLIDNIKGRKNDQELEAIITSSVIDGWKPYHGDARRPNLLTWFLTSNTPSVSNDLAERSIVIRLGPQKHEKDFVGWAEAFIDEHRAALLAELFAVLKGPAQCEIKNRDRWVAWQNSILSLFPNGNELAELIIGRRIEVDADREDAEMIADVITDLFIKHGQDADKDNVFITSAQMFHAMKKASAIPEDMGRKGCATWIKDRCGVGPLKRMKWKKMTATRGFLWVAAPLYPDKWAELPDDPSGTYGWSDNQ